MGEAVGNLPSGAVTLLLADIEGSTALWERRPDEMAATVAELARAGGDRGRAEEYVQWALAAAQATAILPQWRLVIVLLLADIWASRGREEDATRLLAGVRREVDRTGVVWEIPLFEAARGDSVEACRRALGSERFDEVWAAGAGRWGVSSVG